MLVSICVFWCFLQAACVRDSLPISTVKRNVGMLLAAKRGHNASSSQSPSSFLTEIPVALTSHLVFTELQRSSAGGRVSCKNIGCSSYVKGRECQCNSQCKKWNACCIDYKMYCAIKPKLSELLVKGFRKRWKWHTGGFPKNPNKAKSYQKKKKKLKKHIDPMFLMYCEQALACERELVGVGRLGVSSWVWLALVICVTWLAIIVGTSYVNSPSKQHTNLRVNALTGFIAMLAAVLCTGGATTLAWDIRSADPMGPISFVCAYILLLIFNVVVFHCVGVEFKWPEFHRSTFLQTFSMFRFLVCWVCLETIKILNCAVNELGPYYVEPEWWAIISKSSILYIIENAYYFNVVAHTPWSMGMLVWVGLYVRETGRTFYYWGDTTGTAPSIKFTMRFPSVFMTLVFLVLCCFIPYTRDRRFVAAMGYLSASTAKVCRMRKESVVRDLVEEVPLLISMFVMIPTCLLLMRYQRVLPHQLQKASYVRLSYLQAMLCEGKRIQRCQDVPYVAFGNPAKAKHLIIISHRWLDRHTCDVATDQYPHGLRLSTMCQRLENLFPWTWPTFSSVYAKPVAFLHSAWQSTLYAGHDVLCFFDFMALPQIGISEDGTIVDRSAEEQQLFKEVLPAMGGLYTMFPVLVCPEVNEGSPSYNKSGWCSCEFEQASQYEKVIDDEDTCIHHASFASHETHSKATTLEERIKEHMDTFEVILSNKNFYFESDRDAVRSIVRGSFSRRLLMDAVKDQDIEDVRALLKHFTEYNLNETIDFAVDHESLDTLLHIAMCSESRAIVEALLAAGANMDSVNGRGDRPDQWFLLPKAWPTS